ncbi:hypothetical protein KY328_01570, partial [Candidatus Woesearchaeota archaeon]|nr:hypothetical protein [Candidatus Woesearchaeota archaeon]
HAWFQDIGYGCRLSNPNDFRASWIADKTCSVFTGSTTTTIPSEDLGCTNAVAQTGTYVVSHSIPQGYGKMYKFQTWVYAPVPKTFKIYMTYLYGTNMIYIFNSQGAQIGVSGPHYTPNNLVIQVTLNQGWNRIENYVVSYAVAGNMYIDVGNVPISNMIIGMHSESAIELDADGSKEYCEDILSNMEWLENVGCCGDDGELDDSGILSTDNKQVCAFNYLNDNKWHWHSADEVSEIQNAYMHATRKTEAGNAFWIVCKATNLGTVEDGKICASTAGGPRWIDAAGADSFLKITEIGTYDAIGTVEPGGIPAVYECHTQPGASPVSGKLLRPGDAVPIDPDWIIDTDKGKSFLCTAQAGRDIILECCDGYCKNIAQPEKTVKPGMTSTSLTLEPTKSFTIPLLPDTHTVEIERLKNWTDFQTLEFDIKFDQPPSRIYIKTALNEEIFSGKIVDHAKSEWAADRWIHISIPITDLQNKQDIAELVFTATALKTSTVEISGLMVKNQDTQYCSGEYFIWVKDLDAEGVSVNNRPPYQFVCDKQASYSWSGSKCCGDDTSEYYADTLYGCWNNVPIEINNTVANASGLSEQYSDLLYSDNQVYKVCTDSSKYSQNLPFSNAEYCEIGGDYFCSYENKWSKEPSGDAVSSQRNTTKEVPAGLNLLISRNKDLLASCADGIINNGEYGVDCGGELCDPCDLACEVRTECRGSEFDILHLSDRTNARAELNTYNNFKYKVCCNFPGTLSTSVTSGETPLISLDSETNAFVEVPALENYGIDLYASLNPGKLECEVRQNTCGDDACILSLSSKDGNDYTNLHVGECDSYYDKLCCEINNEPSCIDSDGDSMYIPGSVITENVEDSGEFIDSCIDETNLKEYICSNNLKSEKSYSCSEGCYSQYKVCKDTQAPVLELVTPAGGTATGISTEVLIRGNEDIYCQAIGWGWEPTTPGLGIAPLIVVPSIDQLMTYDLTTEHSSILNLRSGSTSTWTKYECWDRQKNSGGQITVTINAG